jgi:hypothetical protein
MADRPDLRPLVIVSAASGVYDVLLGLALLAGRPLLQSLFSLPAPAPPIHADLNGLFAIAVGVGYVLPCRRPDAYRGYLWVMGPLLKGLGALLFVVDHVARHSPTPLLAFAVADGTLAALTAWALTKTSSRT